MIPEALVGISALTCGFSLCAIQARRLYRQAYIVDLCLREMKSYAVGLSYERNHWTGWTVIKTYGVPRHGVPHTLKYNTLTGRVEMKPEPAGKLMMMRSHQKQSGKQS